MNSARRRDDIDELLGTLIEAAARRALSSLDALSDREDAAEHDRGARSVESPARVAATAAAHRSKLNKDAAEDADRTPGEESDDRRRAEARKLAEFFDVELRRIRVRAGAVAADGGGE